MTAGQFWKNVVWPDPDWLASLGLDRACRDMTSASLVFVVTFLAMATAPVLQGYTSRSSVLSISTLVLGVSGLIGARAAVLWTLTRSIRSQERVQGLYIGLTILIVLIALSLWMFSRVLT